MAFQVRENDTALIEQLKVLTDIKTKAEIEIEREVLQQFGGSCQSPVGVFCQMENGDFRVWASFAKSWKDVPVRTFIRSKRSEYLAQTVIEKIKNIKPASVFISRDLDESSFFKRCLESWGSQVFEKSLVAFSPVGFDKKIHTDWLFFSSKNGVKFFFEQNPVVSPKVKFAAIGPGTARALEQAGFQPDVVGDGKSMDDIAVGFVAIAGDEKICFPRGATSARSIQARLEKVDMAISDLIVYENQPLENVDVPDCEVLVFTSPMNAETYFAHKEKGTKQNVIAIGESTAQKLRELGIEDLTISYSPEEWALVDVVAGVC